MENSKSFVLSFKKLGNSIKNKREQRQISIKEMSVLTGIRAEYFSKIEHGSAFGVKVEKHLLKIAGALNIKLSDLFDFEQS